MSLLDALLLDPHPLDVWIAYRTDGVKGSGTHTDPWDGSTKERFDAIMANLPAGQPLRVHLGPTGPSTPFQTSGFWILSDGTTGGAWQPKPNMAIVGAGVGVTSLQLVPGSQSNAHYFAIGAPTTVPVDSFELSDLTIDCNLPSSGTVACGAVRVMGNHVRVQRVKCVNWGSRTTARTAFVIALVIADPEPDSPLAHADDAGLDGCIAVDPSANSAANAPVSIIHVGGREISGTSPLTQFGRAPFIRNCFVDCNDPESSAEFRGLSMGACHAGVVERNQIHNTKYGGPYQDTLNTREIIVRHNTYRNVIKGPFWNLGQASGLGVAKLLVEGNNIDLIADSVTPTPIGIHVHDNAAETAPHGQVIIRNNKIRYLDGTAGSFNGYGIEANGAEALIVSDNVAEVVPENPLRNTRCDAATYFNNQAPDGTLILGWDWTLEFHYGELATDAEDAFVLAYLNKQ